MAWIQIGSQRQDRAQVDEHARRAASGFAAMGIGRGDVVAICMRNDFAFLEASFGAQHVGAYVTMVNWHGTPAEIAYVLADSQARVLVVHEDLLATIAEEVPPGITVFSVPLSDDIRRDYRLGETPLMLPSDARAWDDWLAAHAPTEAERAPSGGTMIYTSGTTGKPKAVKREAPTQDEARSTFECYMTVYGAELHRQDPEAIVAMAAGPLYHAAPSAWTNYYYRLGASLLLESKFSAERLLRVITQNRVTHLLAVPTMFVRLLDLPEAQRLAHDVSSLEFVMHGAAPCPPHVKTAMIDWWGPIVTEHYGGTETGALTFCSSAEWLARPGTVGRRMPDVALRVLDPQGQDCAPGETGEIYGRRLLFPDFTYLHDPAKRAAAERDGLISLGDKGYVDAEGYLFITGRSSDMIISGGVNIFPAEIEAELLKVPGVEDCAVFGIPDPEFGEKVCAVLQPAAGSALQVEEVSAFLKQRIAAYKVPRRYEIQDSLPREDSGKIMKRKLREPFWAEAGREI